MPTKTRFDAWRTVAMAATMCAASLLAGHAAHAAGAPAITATHAWIRWLPSNLPAAGYVTLANASDKNIDLIDIASPDYGSAMLHQTVSNGSSTHMVMVDKATVPAHGTLAIAPVGYHIMLEAPTRKIAPGDSVHLQLKFSDGETLDTPFAVKAPGTLK